VSTSANATYQMLFAYSEHPGSFCDGYLSNGLPGHDGIPDVLNECRWGLNWLLKMNPGPGIMYNQIADDRDHVGFRLPNHDTANYGKGKERPVYFCTGKPQGLFKYKNRTTGNSLNCREVRFCICKRIRSLLKKLIRNFLNCF